MLGHPAEGQQRLRSRHGRCVGRLHSAAQCRLPLVCLDETSKQLIAEARTPIPMKRGRAARIDYEYERNGTANLFMLFAPLEGWRHVEVTDHRRRLRSRLERSGRSPLPARQDHRAGPGQSRHPQQGVTLRSLSGRRSQTAGRALRMALHAQARQLARSRGVRTRCPLRSVSRSPHPRQTDPHRGNRRLGTRPKCQSHKGRLAIHNPIRSSQTQVPIPFDLAESAD